MTPSLTFTAGYGHGAVTSVFFLVRLASLCLLAFVAPAPSAWADALPSARVDFAREVLPILRRACFECHGPQEQEAGLRLDERNAAIRGGESGPILLPGKADASELYRRISLPKGHAEIMPARGEPLSNDDIRRIRDWINQGAQWPERIEPTTHWSYVKPIRPAFPIIQDTTWPRSAIDLFILARLERESLRPSPEADRATLLRRVYLDLIGLPPAPAAVESFLKDRSPDGYERVVDRLLASPEFGERWARAWLDLARYADSHGFQRDDLREVWAYRDWVIEALNDDMPFDQFTLEQLAGDLLPEATMAQRIATGFHRCTTTNVEAGSEPEETRVNQVIDRVNTTAAVWLGATLECAQCHDHKYDPFTQRDYYRLLAYFNNTQIEADRANPMVPGSIRFLGPRMPLEMREQQSERARLDSELERFRAETKARQATLAANLDEWAAELVASGQTSAQTHALEVADFSSAGGAAHRILEDHSVLLVDDAPDTDTYTVTVRTKLTGITGFKLEALTDPSLPGMGPGRGDAQRPNFVLNTFRVSAAPTDSATKTQPISLRNATADFAQRNFPPAGAIDDDPKTAWAINPQFHKPHWAMFETSAPVGSASGMVLTFTLVQEFGGGRTIGRLRLSALTGDPRGRATPADIAAILQTPAKQWTPTQRQRLADLRGQQDVMLQRLSEQQRQLEQQLKKLEPPSTLVMKEQPRRSTAIFKRGVYTQPGAAVEAGVPELLHQAPDGPADRRTLARWLAHRDNPLVARVTVNRWWAELFGQGIVSTVEDFGIKGEPPTHPELLDWLAVEFMDSGWSMKHVLRQIVTSATYRQSSRIAPELLARDDQNRLYARGPRFRLDAETIRDNALTAAGLTCFKKYGPPIRPFQPDGVWTKIGGDRVEYVTSAAPDCYRRGVYVVWKRGAPYPSFVNFDASARLACTVKRSRSNTPLQALTLLNDPVYVEIATALAHRVLAESPSFGIDERLRYAFRLCVAREPKENEVYILRRLYEQQLAAGTSSKKSGDSTPASVSSAERAAWCAVATALLNLDEMITKG